MTGFDELPDTDFSDQWNGCLWGYDADVQRAAMQHIPNPGLINTPLDAIREAVADAVNTCPYDLLMLRERSMASRILKYVNTKARQILAVENAMSNDKKKFELPKDSTGLEAACEILAGTGDVAVLVDDGTKVPCPTLAYYSRTGENAGVWTEVVDDSDRTLSRAIALMNVRRTASTKLYIDQLMDIVPEIHYTKNPHIYPLADGVVEFADDGSRTFTPYLDDLGQPNPDYEQYYGRNACIVGKCAARYAPGIPVPSFTCSDGYVWDPLTHFVESTGGNADAVKVMLQSVLFGVRGIYGGNAFWLLDGSADGEGGGGKGTIGNMFRAAIGAPYSSDLNLSQIVSKDFYLGLTVGKRLVFGNESSAPQRCIDESDVFKQMVRGEPNIINNKYRKPFPSCYSGIWYQCFNELPKFKEKSTSLYRGIVPIYFPNAYTTNVSRKDIKDVFSVSQEVADWLVNYALDTCGDVAEYDAEAVNRLRSAISDIQAESSSVYMFLEEYMAESSNAEIPLSILFRFYDMFARDNNYYSVDYKTFRHDVRTWTGMRNGRAQGWRVADYENARRKKEIWMIDRWMSEHQVPGLAGSETGRIVLSTAVVNARDRHWLLRGAPMAAPGGPSPADELGDDAAYAAYRAGVAAMAMDHPDLTAGLDVRQLILQRAHWERLIKPMPAWLFRGTAPGSDALIIRDGTAFDATILPEEYFRAMRAAVVDVNISLDLSRFLAAASS